jgi:hypothetical protein
MIRQQSDIERSTTLAWRWSGRDWAILLLLAVLTALFFWRILTPNPADRASFPPGDFSHQFWAFSTFEARELSSGRLPLWNPYTYAGAPFWADIQSAVLYPPSLLTLMLSGLWGFSLFALEVEAIAHFWLAGVATYLFARRLLHHRGAALFAAITFAFGGYLTSYPSQQLAVLEADVWLPLLLFFADRALVDRSGAIPRLRLSIPDVLAAGLAWGLALLAGHPQSAMFLFYTFALYVIFLIFAYRGTQGNMATGQATAKFPEKNKVRARAYLVVAPISILLIGLGISAIAWLPGLEYMRLSVRAAGWYGKMSGGFPLHDVLQFLWPGSVSLYSPLYVGILPLLLALWAALGSGRDKSRRRETTFWGALALGALLLSFGGETFLYTPLYLVVPGFGIFRDQERAAFLVSFGLAILAGYGFRRQLADVPTILSAGGTQAKERTHLHSPISAFQSVVGWLLIGAVGLVILFFYGLTSSGWQDSSPYHLVLNRSLWLLILLALTWGLLQVTRDWAKRSAGRFRHSAMPGFLATGYFCILVLDLFTANWTTNTYPTLPEVQTAVPPLVEAIRDDASTGEPFRVYNEYRIYENYGLPYAMEDTWGASPLRLASYDEMHRSLRMERIWQLLNVKYVITWRKELYAPSEIIYQEAAGDGVTYVHRLTQVAPRAWLVYHVQETDEAQALSQLDAFDFDPAQVALVPTGTSLTLQPPTGDTQARVEIVQRTPTSLALDVDAPADGLLVLSEVYFPGWRAVLDGQVTPILKTDAVLRGVPVGAGQHHLELTYRPLTFIWGAVISGLTLAVLALLGLGLWWRHKVRTPQLP